MSKPIDQERDNQQIAQALRACDWSNMPIGNKAILQAACEALEKPAGVAVPDEKQFPSMSMYPDGKEFAAACGEVSGWNACRKAMQAAAPYRGEQKVDQLRVWEGPMPESNGKTNYTAILHKGDISEGMTIARSEYPDRVRYEADEVRWLIGERAERPDILDYDADKHSGYTPPPKPTAQDVAGLVEIIYLAKPLIDLLYSEKRIRGDGNPPGATIAKCETLLDLIAAHRAQQAKA